MKKFLTLLAIIAALVLALASCGGGMSYKPTEHIHSEIIDAAVAATCTETGLTEGKHCSECGEVLVAQETVAALGHNYSNGICSDCGDTCYSEGLDFTSNGDGTCYVSGIGSCTDADLIIPDISPEGDSVTSVGKEAFIYRFFLTSVVIPDSVTSIGDRAFYDCDKLTSVIIGDSVTSIGNSAFLYCSSLTSVVIGDSVTSIGSFAFFNCSSLTSVVIPDSVTSIGDSAFYVCNSLTEIKVSENNENYKSIDGNLYTKDGKTLIQYAIGKTATEFTIPDSVTSIGRIAFYDCYSLTSVVIPDSVTSIGDRAFIDTALYHNESNWENGVLYIGNHLIEAEETISGEYAIKQGTLTIADYAFSGCDSLTSVVIPVSVTSIGAMAFWCCDNLTSVVIPDSVTSIGVGAFSSCKSLTKITVSENNKNYKSIDGNLYTKDGETLMQYATGKTATEFTIPDSVTSIGYEAFFDCSSLTSVVIPNSVTSIGAMAFCWCTSLTDVYYTGSEDDWAKISIGDGNDELTGATIHYNYVPDE